MATDGTEFLRNNPYFRDALGIMPVQTERPSLMSYWSRVGLNQANPEKYQSFIDMLPPQVQGLIPGEWGDRVSQWAKLYQQQPTPSVPPAPTVGQTYQRQSAAQAATAPSQKVEGGYIGQPATPAPTTPKPPEGGYIGPPSTPTPTTPKPSEGYSPRPATSAAPKPPETRYG